MHQKMGYDWEQSLGGGVVGAPPAHRAQVQDGTVGKPSKRSKRIPEGHFDPDELCRRLYMVLADQKAHADRKRRARAEAAVPSSSSAPRTGATTIITNININNTNISNSTNYNHNINTSSTGRRGEDTKHRSQNGRRPESFPTSSQPPQPATASTDLITELRRSRSSAKHKPSRHGLVDADPNVNGIISEDQYHPSEYHHVPKEAAKQFARTTTVDIMRAKESESFVHQLSKRALKFHKQGGRAATDSVVPSELNRALRHSQTQREKVLDRNQFQRTRIMEEAAHLDHERAREEAFLSSSNRPHTFERELARILPERRNSQQQNNRRNSTGNTEAFDRAPGGIDDQTRRSIVLMDPLLDGDEDATPPEEQPPGRVLAHEHRVDWSQSDESGRRPKLLLSPLLRKADSLWGLRNRLANKGSASSSGGVVPPVQERVSRGGSQESVTAVAPVVPSATTPKSPKSSFFAKFKR